MVLLVSFLLAFAAVVSSDDLTADQTGSGCQLATEFLNIRAGFDVTAYEYSQNSAYTAAYDSNFFDHSYSLQSIVDVASGLSFVDYGFFSNYIFSEQFYDGDGPITFQATGYFVPPETGIYGFSMSFQVGGAMLWVGTNNAFDCCHPGKIPKNSLYSSDDSNNGYLLFETDITSYNFEAFVYMEEGLYYPLRLVSSSYDSNTYFSFSYTTPSQEYFETDWSSFIVSVNDFEDGLCIGQNSSFPSTTILNVKTDLLSTSTSHYEHLISLSTETELLSVVSVDYPVPSSTILTTTSYSGVAYSTISYGFSIDSTTTTPIAYSYYYAALPSSASHTYEYTGTSSGTSSLIYVSNVDGVSITVTDVAVLVPEGDTVVTWTETTPATSYITTTALNSDDAPQLTTVTYDYVLISATNSYAYTGTFSGTTTLTYTSTVEGVSTTVTDVAVLVPEGDTVVTWTATTPATSYITTTALNSDDAPQLTTVTYDYVLISATNSYAYTGTFSGTTTLTYTSTVEGVSTTVTDVAVLVPEGDTVVTWTETTPATSYITTTALNSDDVPQLTTVTYKYDLMNATHSYAYNGVFVISSTLIYSATNRNGTYLTTDVAVLYPEGYTVVTWNRNSSLTSYLTTTALINNVPVLTTIDYRFVPSPSSSMKLKSSSL
ncbi:hypothetical protein C6P40_000716, partial [Pichia californica]